MLVKKICPLVGKQCISDGFTEHTMRTGVLLPCMFYEPVAPEYCRMKRAVNVTLAGDDAEMEKATGNGTGWEV